MPRIPKWMANAMESLFSGNYRPVKVTAAHDLDRSFKKVRFEGDFSTLKRDFISGQVIEFRVSDTEFRHYTPSYFSKDEGVCEVLFYLHDMGPGSRWAQQLNIGDEIKLIGPGGKIAYNPDANIHVVYGDETSLGLMQCMTRESLSKGHHIYCIADMPEEHHNWTTFTGLDRAVICAARPGEASHTFSEWWSTHGDQESRAAFYLTGQAKSLQAFRDKLLAEGISHKCIKTDPYWSTGKCGL